MRTPDLASDYFPVTDVWNTETEKSFGEWEQEGLLDYETCEARVPGSFDDKADDDEYTD